MWFLSNTFKENLSNLLLQSQFGLVKTLVTSASHGSSEKVCIDIAAGILSRSHVQGKQEWGTGETPQGWRAECTFEGKLWRGRTTLTLKKTTITEFLRIRSLTMENPSVTLARWSGTTTTELGK